MLLDMYLFFCLPFPRPIRRTLAGKPLAASKRAPRRSAAKSSRPARGAAAAKPKVAPRRQAKAALRVVEGGRPGLR
ncbi:hypothetical protein [Myxococcus landrumensis]|uniref:Uncharacterized protein n=1 Tax=Myxococcus landrumensis TaxID=2813577 RepID=A0ABX7NAF7_9BACT|nr:hypothetical protein [Myxococcus landrumus]QSQ15633.1 hypothetical protein JY572_06095 [Myxococcus landrumus]